QRRLTLPSRGRSKGRFAPFGPPLMSNVRRLATSEVLIVAPSESSETQRHFGAIASALAGEPNVSVGSSGKKGFGSSALQVGGKIFAMISSNGSFVVKLPK